MLLLGAHISIAGGVSRAFARAEALNCSAMQIFTKNANQWRAKPLPEEETAAFAAAWQGSPVESVIAHDSYLINLAAPEGETRRRSLEAFADELERCALLGVPALVMHPGAHLGDGEEVGLQRITEAFRILFAGAPAEVSVLLENTAGQGTCLGHRFEHLATIMEKVPAGRFGVCLDTCHALAAGYDLTSTEGYQSVMEDFDRLIGTGRIEAFHLNDSKKERGSGVDRHEHIGRGAVALEVFRTLMRDERFRSVPKILETDPGEDNCHHRAELALLRRLAGEQR